MTGAFARFAGERLLLVAFALAGDFLFPLEFVVALLLLCLGGGGGGGGDGSGAGGEGVGSAAFSSSSSSSSSSSCFSTVTGGGECFPLGISSPLSFFTGGFKHV